MSAQETRFIEPLDVLFLRGNKLFGDPGSYGEALIPPWPSAAAGALRSRLLADAGVDLAAFARGPGRGLLGALRPRRLPLLRVEGEGLEPRHGFIFGSEAVKNALRASGLFTESRLARGEQVVGDMKAALRDALVRMGQSPRMVDGLRQATQSAVREIESSQADSLAAASQRELSFGFVIPFKDADPVLVQFFRPRKTQEQPDPPFTINLHTQSQDLGEVWMKTMVSPNRSLDLVMWADRADTASRAQKAKAELVEELEGAGLSVKTLLVVHGKRPPEPSPVIGEAPGVVFDRQA